jgi:hypothetical protein
MKLLARNCFRQLKQNGDRGSYSIWKCFSDEDSQRIEFAKVAAICDYALLFTTSS